MRNRTMSTFERALPILLLTLMPLCAQACAGPEEAEEAAGERLEPVRH